MRLGHRALPIVVAIAVLVASFAFVRWWDFTLPTPGRSTYQAVFLANGQTFLGRYHDRIGPYVKIEDAYYIQQVQDPADPARPPDSRIVRRGGELHSPESVMLIPKTSVLFVEDLADTSPVARFMAQDRP